MVLAQGSPITPSAGARSPKNCKGLGDWQLTPTKELSTEPAMTACDANPFADGCTGIVGYGGARPTDTHLASTINCVDEEIFEWLIRRERRRKREGMTNVGARQNRIAQEPLDRGPKRGPDRRPTRLKSQCRLRETATPKPPTGSQTGDGQTKDRIGVEASNPCRRRSSIVCRPCRCVRCRKSSLRARRKGNPWNSPSHNCRRSWRKRSGIRVERRQRELGVGRYVRSQVAERIIIDYLT